MSEPEEAILIIEEFMSVTLYTDQNNIKLREASLKAHNFLKTLGRENPLLRKWLAEKESKT